MIEHGLNGLDTDKNVGFTIQPVLDIDIKRRTFTLIISLKQFLAYYLEYHTKK